MINIPQLYDSHLEAERDRRGRRTLAHTNSASELGNACERALVYRRVCPEAAQVFGVDALRRFHEGDLHEGDLTRTLYEAGVKIICQQITGQWERYRITGHMDGLIIDPETGAGMVVEIKSLNPNTWRKIQTASDFDHVWWCKKYLDQMLVYLLLDNRERGLFILKNKSSGELKQVDVLLNDWLERAEGLIQKAERINAAVDDYNEARDCNLDVMMDAALPERINDPEICEGCQFRTHCGPTLTYGPEITAVADAALYGALRRRAELEQGRADYNRLDAAIKARFPEEGAWLALDPDNPEAMGFEISAKRDSRGALRFKITESRGPGGFGDPEGEEE